MARTTPSKVVRTTSASRAAETASATFFRRRSARRMRRRGASGFTMRISARTFLIAVRTSWTRSSTEGRGAVTTSRASASSPRAMRRIARGNASPGLIRNATIAALFLSSAGDRAPAHEPPGLAWVTPAQQRGRLVLEEHDVQKEALELLPHSGRQFGRRPQRVPVAASGRRDDPVVPLSPAALFAVLLQPHNADGTARNHQPRVGRPFGDDQGVNRITVRGARARYEPPIMGIG